MSKSAKMTEIVKASEQKEPEDYIATVVSLMNVINLNLSVASGILEDFVDFLSESGMDKICASARHSIGFLEQIIELVEKARKTEHTEN